MVIDMNASNIETRGYACFFDELHEAHASERLGGRENCHHRVGGQRLIFAQFALAGRAFVEIFVAIRRHRDDARRAYTARPTV